MKKLKCFGCGVEKDMDVLEVYSHPETDMLCEDPLVPLFALECQPLTKGDPWKMVVVCHECFHKLEPDMWIGENCWKSLDPVVLFEDLPEELAEEENPNFYAIRLAIEENSKKKE